MGKKNILFVQNDLNPTSGGIAKVSNILGKYFAKKGHDVYFLYFDSDNEEIDDAHKCKFQLTNNNRLMYKQIADFVKGISGGGRCCSNTVNIFLFHQRCIC